MNPKQQQELLKLAYMKMPFGKFKGVYLSDIPEAYFTWFKRKGFPSGKLGERMQMGYELKINGDEGILKVLRQRYPDPFRD